MGEPVIEIGVLGRFAVRLCGDEVPNEAFGGRLPRRLVRVLTTRLGQVVPRDVLIEALWPRRAPRDPDGNLNVLVNRARRALDRIDVIETEPGGYRLAADACDVDVVRFRRRCEQGRAAVDEGRPAVGLSRLLQGLELWAEPYPEDVYEEWAQPVRRVLHDDHQAALELAAHAALLVHQPDQAAALARRALESDPLREQVHLLLVRALAASGERAGALAALGSLRRLLHDELGVDLSDEAAELERQLLVRPPPRQPTSGRPALRHDGTDRFVGRRRELELLDSLAPGERRVAVVEGIPGSGKSSLLAESAARSVLPVFLARAFLPEASTPWALARTVLREVLSDDVGVAHGLARAASSALRDLVLPDLPGDASTGPALEQETRRALAMEGALRILDAAAWDGAVVLVDDLQWADASSLELLELAVARLDRLVLVLAHRPLPDPDQVRSFLAHLEELTSVLELTVGDLGRSDLADLTGDAALADVLVDEGATTPFAACAALARLRDEGHLRGDAPDRPHADRVALQEAARRAAREGMRRSVVDRTAQQGPLARQLLSLLAVLGREASAALLARASARSPREVLAELDRLARAGLVRLGDRGWAPAHDIIAEVVVDHLTSSELSRLHLFIADALDDVAGAPGERALHLLGAADDGAAAALAQAARAQLERHAHREAAHLASLGLDADPDPSTRRDLLVIRADTRVGSGDLAGAGQDLRAALGGPGSGPARSSLLVRSARLALAAGDVDHAGQLADLALVEAGRDAAARAEALAAVSIVDMNGRDEERARARASEALELYRRIGDAAGAADILDARAMATFLGGDIRHGVEAFDRVARLFEASGNLLRVVTPRSTRGHALVFLGAPERGRADADAAYRLAVELGHVESQAYSLWHRSEAETDLGRIDDALTSAHTARSLAEQVGHRGWTATAWRAIGVAQAVQGDHPAALRSFERSLDAGASVPLFACWAHARISLSASALGDLRRAAEHARHALAIGPPLGLYEARLAEAVHITASGDPTAGARIAAARRQAIEGGHTVSADALGVLLDPQPPTG